ncbi:Porphyrin biosynthetic protein [Salmonella enterica subsp. enterica]|uniref:Porphyrin biosynthetic protein n=1 Tax=Salmonella enterica I TaxID=59201 RepID=A0A447TR90_SALET|nr:Porphyrin biosynthetic protein [Salmonella enterica subsp. enterica]
MSGYYAVCFVPARTPAVGLPVVNAVALASRPNRPLLKLAEGDYQQVEKLMSKNADHAEQPVVNYLLAAEAAQQRGDEARANQHLERAAELAGNDTIPVEITRVRLQLARNENHAARHGVDKLLEVTPRHPEVLRLAEQAYIRTSAWSSFTGYHPIHGESARWR